MEGDDEAIELIRREERETMELDMPLELNMDRFRSVLAEAAGLREQRLAEYGLDRFDEEELTFALLMCYSDVYRKFIRLKTLTKNRGDLAALRDTYIDMLNYAAQAVMEIDRFTEGT